MRALVTTLAAALLWTGAAFAQTAPAQTASTQTAPTVTSLGATPPETALYIGNSFFYYNNGISSMVTGLARNAATPGPDHRGTMSTIGGSGFDWHDVETLFRPNAVGSYTFDANNNIVFNDAPQKYAAAILMDCSQCPIHPTLAPVFRRYARLHAATVRRHGAIPILFMSWAYQDHPEMTAALAEAYTEAGNETGALVIPAGLAWARALKDRPGLQLHVADKRHPTLAGSYLAAATIYAAVTGRSPVENGFTAGLDPDLARFLRTEAWDTARAYYAGTVVN